MRPGKLCNEANGLCARKTMSDVWRQVKAAFLAATATPGMPPITFAVWSTACLRTPHRLRPPANATRSMTPSPQRSVCSVSDANRTSASVHTRTPDARLLSTESSRLAHRRTFLRNLLGLRRPDALDRLARGADVSLMPRRCHQQTRTPARAQSFAGIRGR